MENLVSWLAKSDYDPILKSEKYINKDTKNIFRFFFLGVKYEVRGKKMTYKMTYKTNIESNYYFCTYIHYLILDENKYVSGNKYQVIKNNY